jgi:hypothetical protein
MQQRVGKARMGSIASEGLGDVGAILPTDDQDAPLGEQVGVVVGYALDSPTLKGRFEGRAIKDRGHSLGIGIGIARKQPMYLARIQHISPHL